MNHALRPLLLCSLLFAGCATTGPDGPARAALSNDFPTKDRVEYVHECMKAHPGPGFEMVDKCSCALDKIAGEMKFDEFVGLSTAANATSIGGERGGVMRDNESVQKEVKRYRELQARAKKSCFIDTGAR